MRTTRRFDRTARVATRFDPARCGAATAAALLILSALAAGPPEEKKADEKPGAIVLFDGKSLDGWKKTAFYKPGEVKIEDGAIVMAAGKPMTGVTTTRQDLPKTNYELSYEAMRISGDDFFAAATFPVGSSFLTLVNGGWSGGVTGLSSLNGADASENETNRAVRYKNGTWYKFRVEVTDEAIRYWIDGKAMAAVHLQGRAVGTRVETNASKPLGFATYGTSGAVRKIEVRTLTPAEIRDVNQAE